ncbi:hypothetical protein FOL85_09800 [Lactobacillus reuteri]|uniref:hypothetical protein n=1 Tax=Limosilactobacillus reuteri TaxID=1598 RepID=UPI00146DC3A7|nr:hypothetical protein [Limosilactobacillus reuteri]NMV51765.1 hypothetical protein [Limosilactobacillus reuteri]NMV56877.1 hypothetical protein [Limosilactobacillus reuteri]NMV65383.1 hypothetical protein [Limosilactobacillus reuteri]
MATSEATKRAIKNYQEKNPLLRTYWNRKGGARQFILADLSKDTKLSQAINENRMQYIKDLKELRNDIDQRLKDIQQ